MMADSITKATLTPLNAPLRKPSTGSTSGNTALTESVRVVDVKFNCNYIHDFNCRLQGLSIHNELEYSVKRIRVVFILYSASGIPLDYVDMTLCTDRIKGAYDITNIVTGTCIEVPSRLSKYFNFERISGSSESCPRTFMKKQSEKLVTRILDFEIVRN